MDIVPSDSVFSKKFNNFAEIDAAALSAMVTEKVLVSMAEVVARAVAQAVSEVRAKRKRSRSSESVDADLLAYITWGGDGGRHCD